MLIKNLIRKEPFMATLLVVDDEKAIRDLMSLAGRRCPKIRKGRTAA
jgi:hypothetical protein